MTPCCLINRSFWRHQRLQVLRFGNIFVTWGSWPFTNAQWSVDFHRLVNRVLRGGAFYRLLQAALTIYPLLLVLFTETCTYHHRKLAKDRVKVDPWSRINNHVITYTVTHPSLTPSLRIRYKLHSRKLFSASPLLPTSTAATSWLEVKSVTFDLAFSSFVHDVR